MAFDEMLAPPVEEESTELAGEVDVALADKIYAGALAGLKAWIVQLQGLSGAKPVTTIKCGLNWQVKLDDENFLTFSIQRSDRAGLNLVKQPPDFLGLQAYNGHEEVVNIKVSGTTYMPTLRAAENALTRTVCRYRFFGKQLSKNKDFGNVAVPSALLIAQQAVANLSGGLTIEM